MEHGNGSTVHEVNRFLTLQRRQQQAFPPHVVCTWDIYIAPLYTELQQHMLILPRTYLNGEVLQLFVGSQKLRFTEVYFESYLSTEVY